MGSEAIVEDFPFLELADSVPVMLWRINANFDCDWANTAWFEFTGGTLAQQTGFAWLDLVHPDDSDRVVEAFGRAFEAREKVSVEFRIRRADGRYRWVLDSGAPYFRDGVFAASSEAASTSPSARRRSSGRRRSLRKWSACRARKG
jgi:PAS domain S-box-containing protein